VKQKETLAGGRLALACRTFFGRAQPHHQNIAKVRRKYHYRRVMTPRKPREKRRDLAQNGREYWFGA